MNEPHVMTARERSLANLRPAKPGECRNPLGRRAPGELLAVYIRENTLEGTKLVDFLLDVLNSELNQFNSVKHKLTAVEMLFNRGWGQAPQTINFGDGKVRPVFDLTKLSTAEFEAFRAIMTKIAPTSENEQETKDGQTVDTSATSQNGSGPTISPSRDPNLAP